MEDKGHENDEVMIELEINIISCTVLALSVAETGKSKMKIVEYLEEDSKCGSLPKIVHMSKMSTLCN